MVDNYHVFDKSGYTSTVYSLPGNPPRVCKVFNEDCVDTLYPVEKAAYERFSSRNHPPSILKYYGSHESISAGLVLELAAHKNLYRYLQNQKYFGRPNPDRALLCRWAMQAAEGLEFAHSTGIYNSDIHCVNFFLDQDLNLKVGDWAGASIDGSRSGSSYRLRHRLFNAEGRDIARTEGIQASTEIFALGTALYCMVANHDLWPDLHEPEDREEIKKRIRAKKFPRLCEIPVLANVIWKCWHVEFASMTEVKQAIEAESSAE